MNKKSLILGGAILLVTVSIIFYTFFIKVSNNKEQEPFVSKEEPATSESLKEKSFGFIYEREAKVSRNGSLSKEFVLFDLSEHTALSINTLLPAIPWQGAGGAPVLLYTQQEVETGSNIFNITVFDLVSAYSKKITIPSDINAFSSIAYSPTEKKVAYCVDDETVFNVLDLVSGEIGRFPSFTGCVANRSFNPPLFSPEGRDIYYQEFLPNNEDGSYNTNYKYRKLSLNTGESSNTSYGTSPVNLRFEPKHNFLANVETFGNDVNSYSNQLSITGGIPAVAIQGKAYSGSIPLPQVSPLVFKNSFGTYVHIGDVQRTNDGSGFFFYTYSKKDEGVPGGDFKIGFFDNDKKSIIYPIGEVPEGYSFVNLVGARDKDMLVFRMKNKTTGLSDLYYSSVKSNIVELVDRSTGLSLPENVYFVESK